MNDRTVTERNGSVLSDMVAGRYEVDVESGFACKPTRSKLRLL
jgi:hypothetical protein